MSRRVAAYVHVAGQVFAPGDEVPDGYAEKITNPAAWGDEDTDETPAKAADSAPAPDPDKVPPRAGRGSSKEAWAQFAMAKGYAVADGATRDDIIADLESNGAIQPEE